MSQFILSLILTICFNLMWFQFVVLDYLLFNLFYPSFLSPWLSEVCNCLSVTFNFIISNVIRSMDTTWYENGGHYMVWKRENANSTLIILDHRLSQIILVTIPPLKQYLIVHNLKAVWSVTNLEGFYVISLISPRLNSAFSAFNFDDSSCI